MLCKKDISSIHLMCNECATDIFSENLFWIAAEPVIGKPIIDRLRYRSEAVLAIGEHPDGELVYKDGDTVMEEIIELYNALEKGEEDCYHVISVLSNTLSEMGVSEDMDDAFFSPSDLKIFSEVFYLVGEIQHKYSDLKTGPELYLNIGNLLKYVGDKADKPDFSPEFREKICQDLWKEAERYYDLAIDVSQDDPLPHLYKGKLLLKMEKISEAKNHFQNALKIDDENNEIKIAYVEALLMEDNLEMAEKFLNEVLDSYPGHAKAWYLKGEELRKKGRWGGALQFYDQAISKNKELTDAYLMKARVLYGNQMTEEANEVLDRSLEIKPTFEAWYWKGKILYEMGRWGGALQCLNEALDLEPHMEDAWVLKGDILTERDLYEEALEAYENSLEIVPNLKEVIEKRKVCKDYIC